MCTNRYHVAGAGATRGFSGFSRRGARAVPAPLPPVSPPSRPTIRRLDLPRRVCPDPRFDLAECSCLTLRLLLRPCLRRSSRWYCSARVERATAGPPRAAPGLGAAPGVPLRRAPVASRRQATHGHVNRDGPPRVHLRLRRRADGRRPHRQGDADL